MWNAMTSKHRKLLNINLLFFASFWSLSTYDTYVYSNFQFSVIILAWHPIMSKFSEKIISFDHWSGYFFPFFAIHSGWSGEGC